MPAKSNAIRQIRCKKNGKSFMFLGVFKINVYDCFFVDAKIQRYISIAKNKKKGFP